MSLAPALAARTKIISVSLTTGGSSVPDWMSRSSRPSSCSSFSRPSVGALLKNSSSASSMRYQLRSAHWICVRVVTISCNAPSGRELDGLDGFDVERVGRRDLDRLLLDADRDHLVPDRQRLLDGPQRAGIDLRALEIDQPQPQARGEQLRQLELAHQPLALEHLEDGDGRVAGRFLEAGGRVGFEPSLFREEAQQRARAAGGGLVAHVSGFSAGLGAELRRAVGFVGPGSGAAALRVGPRGPVE
jgi:hypothetical protein